MKIASLLLAAICLTIGLHSCGQISTQPQVTTTKSMPLHIGNWWKYEYSGRNDRGTKDTSAYLLSEIVDYKLIGSHYYYVEKLSVHNDTTWDGFTFDTFYWRYEGSRLLSGPILDDTTKVIEDELFNESYTIVPYDAVYQEYGFSVLSDSVSIKVPAGTFTNCLEIVSNSRAPDAQVTRILAPKIGIVSEYSFWGRSNLKEYHIVP